MKVIVRKKFYVLYVVGGILFSNLLRLLLSTTFICFVWQVLRDMSVHEFIQRLKRMRSHEDIVLRTPLFLSEKEF